MIKKIVLVIFWVGSIFTHACAQTGTPLKFTIQLNNRLQTIQNIGASGCWFSEEIGNNWPSAQKKRIAELLFSRQANAFGQPKGIGLSAFRFNIGAGTAEQGDSSGIADPSHRVACFLSPDGMYDWSKQAGYLWMVKQAAQYGVKDLIAFVNSPPVQFTRNGLGYKLVKDGTTNLHEDKYDDYGRFMAEVVRHFDAQQLHFNYISPVNEPQWDWSGKKGEAKQEGSPWQNEEIFKVVRSLDKNLTAKKLDTKILITEAGMLNYLYAGNGKTSRQVPAFWNPKSALYVGGFSHVARSVAGHGYFTDNGDEQLINTKRALSDTLKQYKVGLEYWQSEYCMLGNGFLEKTTGKRSAMDCALFLAKVIHHDLAMGNATAWQYWNAYEPGAADVNTRYYLIALNPNRKTDTANRYTVTKNLWALGHYSLFVRPGMYRVATGRDDGKDEITAAQEIMITAFRDKMGKKLVVNMINYTQQNKSAVLFLNGQKGPLHLKKRYVTSARENDDLKPYPVSKTVNNEKGNTLVLLPARSISTFYFTDQAY